MKKKFAVPQICLVLCMVGVYAREENEVNHVLEGNLALPASQQPCPLFSFGQNIVDKGDLQLFGFVNYLSAHNAHFTEVMPNLLYGIRDDLSIFFGLPVAADYKIGNMHSSGLEDMFLQAEYAFYNKDKPTYANQLTVVGNITFPTGSTHKRPRTGLGTASFFLGLTANHLGRDWYVFLSPGINVAARSNDNFSFIYQTGLGRNLTYVQDRFLVSLLVELLGATDGLNKIRGSTDERPDLLAIGPSLWISSKRFILNFGVLVPLIRDKHAPIRNNYLFALNIGWTFKT